jgi:sporulation integral membrane protein YtvI
MSYKMLGLAAIGVILLYAFFTVGFPFLLALVIAILIDPLIVLLMKATKMNRFISSTITCTIFLLGMLGVFYLIGLKVFTELNELARRTPEWAKEIEFYVNQALTGNGVLYDAFPDEWAGNIQSTLQYGADGLVSGLNSLISTVSGLFLNVAKVIPNLLIFCIVFFIALYLFSYSLDRLKGSFLSLFAEESRSKMESVLIKLREAIIGFMRAQIFISILTYIVALLGLIIIGVDYAMAIAFIIILVDLLPILGTGSVIVPWAIYNIIIGDVGTAIGLLILFIVITVFRRIIEPKILGDAVGIGALPILVSLYVGFELVGVVGIFLGPILVIVYEAMKQAGIIKIQIKL